MARRLTAITLIWIATSIAWGLLAATVLVRTDSSGSSLRDQVGSTWGSPQRQAAPALSYDVTTFARNPDTHELESAVTAVPLALTKTDAAADFDLAYRQKGLVSYSTYGVTFHAAYTFAGNDTPHRATLTFTFPAERALYDDFTLNVAGRSVPIVTAGTSVTARLDVAPNAVVPVTVSYRSRGLGSWLYDFGDHVATIRDFRLRMHTNFAAIDFPADTLSPSVEQRAGDGWNLTWQYSNLVTGYSVGMTMPEKMQPGQLAQRLTTWAPISLLFFFLLLFVITTLRRIELHPMNYAFLAGAFFAFHLLFAYSVDHIAIPIAFVLCSLVSMTLVVSYLRLVVGLRFAAVEAGAAQLVYLVLFSFALFFEGWSGLTITAGAIATLFAIMQLTGRVRWHDYFARPVAVADV